MSVQTSVSAAATPGAPGQVADAEFCVTESKVAAGAIPFGAWVVFKVDGECILPAADTDLTGFEGGIALIDHNLDSGDGYVTGDAVKVLTAGKVFPLAEEALALGDTLVVRHGDGAGGTQEGSFRNDSDTSTAAAPATKVTVSVPGTQGTAVVTVGRG